MGSRAISRAAGDADRSMLACRALGFKPLYPLDDLSKLSSAGNHQFFNLQEREAHTSAAHGFRDMPMDEFDVRDLAAVMSNGAFVPASFARRLGCGVG
jgi:hypothetical protein